MVSKKHPSRRDVLKGAACIGAAAAVPAIVPASVFGANGTVAPSNRIVMCAIGTGSMGTGNMNGFLGQNDVQMIAVADVDKKHRERAKGLIDKKYGNANAKAYNDYRELLASHPDLNAVCIAVPDHWHALTAIAAAKAGLDIYGEKPLARSIREGRAIVNAVTDYGRVWQTGSWQRSVEKFRRACELVRNGRIGKVLRAEVGLPNGSPGGSDIPGQPIPEGLDYEMWLGPAPYRPYSPFGNDGVHYQWRWILDYSGGQLTDWAGHHIDIAHWGLGYDHTGPVAVEGKATYPSSGLYNAPGEYKFTCTYSTGVEFSVANAAQQPHGMGTRWIGEKGWIWVDRGGFDCEPKSLAKEIIGPGEIHLYDSKDHKRNFLDCVRSRQLTITPAETALRSISVGLLGEIAMLTGRKIKWDPAKEEIIGDPGANAMLGRSYREPWHL